MVVFGTGKCLGWQYQVLLLIFKQEWFHSDVKGSNGGFWNWQVSGLAISSVAANFSSLNKNSVDFALFQPLRSQHSRIFGFYL